jgi:hypothetical protein
MKSRLLFVCLATAFSAAIFSYPVRADAPTDPTAQLNRIYGMLDNAADRKDMDTCMASLSPNFMLLGLDGKVENSDGQKAHLTQVFNDFNQVDVTTRIDKCDYTDKTATVLISQHIKATIVPTEGAKPVVMEGDLTARQLWTDYPDGWKIDVTQSLTGGKLTPDP